MNEPSLPKEASPRNFSILDDLGCIQLTPERKREANLLLMAMRGFSRHQHRIYEPKELIEKAAREHKSHLSLGWSGGKCSTVLLHMALEITPDILVNYNNTGVEFPENVTYVHKIAQEWKVNFHELKPETNFFACVRTYGFPQLRSRALGKKWKIIAKKGSGFARDKKPMCCHLLKDDVTAKFHSDFNITGDLNGLRAGESRTRAITVGQRGQCYKRKTPYPMSVYLPIALWTTEQVNGYLRSHNIPENPVYNTQTRNGCWPCTGYKSWETNLQRYNPRMYRLVKKMRGEPLLEEWQ